MNIIISVIIPTYNSNDYLNECLRFIHKQSLDKDLFEVIVVNNNPSTPLPRLNFNLNIRVSDESNPGSYHARNKGVSEARGQILAFTDADCMPDVNWLLNIKKFFTIKANANKVLAGRVKMVNTRVRNLKESNVWECYDYIFGINQHLYVRKNMGATANMAVMEKKFNELGGFRTDLFSGGDGEFCKRAYANGLDIVYSENVKVSHPLRSNFKGISLKSRRIVAGKFRLNKVKCFGYTFLPPLVRLKILINSRPPLVVKAKAFFALFILKVDQVLYLIRLMLGIVKPERR